MTIYDFEVLKRDDSKVKLEEYKGKVLLIVNTATGCGFTPQYEALENLYKEYHGKGLEILDFPCNQFGHQAPGSDDEIHEFCQAKYNTSFDQFKKIDVNGECEEPLYHYLKENSKGEYIKGLAHKAAMKSVGAISKTCKEKNDIKWNFTKFLINQEGEVIMRVSPIESPMVMEDKIKELLGE
ncbi:MAG: glutathione peroxidase [Acholeplasmatales bacterium]|nr:glutathione peroxidase [Acholeplasmatales bacterium]